MPQAAGLLLTRPVAWVGRCHGLRSSEVVAPVRVQATEGALAEGAQVRQPARAAAGAHEHLRPAIWFQADPFAGQFDETAG